MGAFCCCPCSEEFEEYSHSNNSIYRHCICLRYFFHQLFSGFGATFQRLDGRSVASSVHETDPLGSTEPGPAPPENSLTETHISVARPLAQGSDQRLTRLQRGGLVFRRDKSSSNFQESQPLRSTSSSGTESFPTGKKWSEVDSDEECKSGRSEPAEKPLLTKLSYGITYILPPSEDEDVCPTCLEEYTPENPKIITRCSHHFHLGCIYEWMERSETCPICGKEMEFCESP
ncbi:hypothetical protein Sjap_000601 [Stephania japonica]|uniref:RING-type E3 ubiquitin transferase n=1 Tax=Stephania japonica TaxID=461633 RepID=A0AAP0KID3_9MAGN